MQNQSDTPSLTNTPAPLDGLLGPAPVLSSENAGAYRAILARLTEALAPRDFLEQLLIKQAADSTWEIIRYTRHMNLAVERRYRDNRQTEDKLAAAAAAAASRTQSPPPSESSSDLTARLQANVDTVHHDIDEIFGNAADELDYARALEKGISYYAELGRLRSIAIEARLVAIEQLGRYRRGAGALVRKASDQIIEGEFSEAAAPSTQVSPPLVPDQGCAP
jgi:hypothetical protein